MIGGIPWIPGHLPGFRVAPSPPASESAPPLRQHTVKQHHPPPYPSPSCPLSLSLPPRRRPSPLGRHPPARPLPTCTPQHRTRQLRRPPEATEPAAVCGPRPRAQQHYLNPLTLTFYYIIPHRAYTSILPFSLPPPRYTHIPLPLASLYPPSPPPRDHATKHDRITRLHRGETRQPIFASPRDHSFC